MSAESFQKPGIDEWVQHADTLVDRLTECVHIYKKQPNPDVFMSDAERQQKTDTTITFLRRLHTLLDQSETPTDSVANAHSYHERTANGMAVLFGEILEVLPDLSSDMQKLLKSPWMSHFPNKIAERLFNGSVDESQGLGSGHPEHGRLPAVLQDLLERERMGDSRRPREDLLHLGEPRRHDMENRERWSRLNGGFLRTAGRVE